MYVVPDNVSRNEFGVGLVIKFDNKIEFSISGERSKVRCGWLVVVWWCLAAVESSGSSRGGGGDCCCS